MFVQCTIVAGQNTICASISNISGRYDAFSLVCASIDPCISRFRTERSQGKGKRYSAVDLELVLAVDVSYSMDKEMLAIQREGYAQAIASKEFLEALKSGPNGKISVTYFEWAASSDQTIIIPWRQIDGPETADAAASEIMTCRSAGRLVPRSRAR